MPKETKKFINPLLRPSQDIEVRSEPVTKTEKPRSSTVLPSPSPVQDSPATTEVKEAAILPDILAPLPIAETSPFPTALTTDAETELPIVEEISVIPLSTETSPPPPSGVPMEPVTERPTIAEIPAAQVATPLIQTTTYTSTDESIDIADMMVEAIPISSETSTYMSTSTLTSTETPDFIEAVQVARAFPSARQFAEDVSYSTSVKGKRRRGEKAFEMTHERITLWIDKRLKSAFEELAYQQESSKTALLNEAMADLLRKYDTD